MSEPDFRRRRIIPHEELGEVRPWDRPDVADPRPPPPEPEPEEEGPKPPTAEQILAIQQEAYDEGYRQGVEEGRAAGKAEYDAKLSEAQGERERLRRGGEELQGLLAALTHPFEALDEAVERELAELAMAAARQIVRRELKLDPGQVVAAVREAAAVLPVASRAIRLRLHPEDAALVREALSLHEGEEAWRIDEDPSLSRGGCTVTTDTSHIDATVERRLNTVIARVLGDERRDDDRS